MLRVVTFKLEEKEIEELDLAARLLGISRSELIRRAIKTYIKKLKPRPRYVRL